LILRMFFIIYINYFRASQSASFSSLIQQTHIEERTY
jgi:hypothetical protein